MSQSMKDIFYHALLARAAYAEIEKSDEMLLKLQNSPQSDMDKAMADFVQSRFDFVASSVLR